MEVIFKNQLDRKRQIYECSVCETWFNWGKGCSWYGSIKNMENDPKKLIYCCSEKCKDEHVRNNPEAK